jgi:hypothetical protein
VDISITTPSKEKLPTFLPKEKRRGDFFCFLYLPHFGSFQRGFLQHKDDSTILPDGAGTRATASGTLLGPEASSSATSSFLSSTPTILKLSQKHQTSQT